MHSQNQESILLNNSHVLANAATIINELRSTVAVPPIGTRAWGFSPDSRIKELHQLPRQL